VCKYDIDENALYTDAVKRDCLLNSNSVGPAGAPCPPVRSSCWIAPQRTSSIMFRCIPDYNVTNTEGAYCSYPPEVSSAADPRCIVITETTNGAVSKPAKPNMLFDQLNSGRQLWGRWFGDLGRAWWVILLVAVGLALLLGFVWVTFLKYFTGCMVWTTIFLSVTVLSFLTGYFYYKAGLVTIELPPSINDKVAAVAARSSAAVATATAYVPQSWKESADQYKVSYSAIAYISTAVLIIVLCVVVAMRNAIRISIEVIKIGSDALRAMPLLTLFPCTNILSIGLFLIWWVFVAASLTSAGDVTTADLAKDVEEGLVLISEQYGVNASAALAQTLGQTSNGTFTAITDMPVMNYLMIYHVFGLLWTAQFLQGIASMTVAGSVCAWYFSQLPKELE
jgi:solute carrier family 44 (choline transporter-like protein), member 2/4/5